MRISYIIIISVSIFITFSYARKANQDKSYASKNLAKMLIASGIAEIANLLIAIPIYGSNLYVMFSHSLYYISIDFLLIYLLLFCYEYTTDKRFQKIKNVGLISVYVIAAVDTLSLFTSIFTGYAYTWYTDLIPNDNEVYVFISMKWPYHLHLSFSYLLVAVIILTLVKATVRSASFYRIKYIAPLSVFLAVVISNAIYMLFSFPLDWSVLFFALAGIMVRFFALIYVPRKLLSKTLHETVNDLNEGLILFDKHDDCIYINKFASDMFNLTTATCSTDISPLSEWIGGVRLKFKSPFEKKCELSVDDRLIIYKLQLKHLTDSKGQYLGCYFLIIDTTKEHTAMKALETATKEAIAAREEATRASQAKGAFLANMSHEIRTPINAILGMNEMILREDVPEEVREYANNIKLSGDALLSLINDILDFSKIESGKMDLQPVEYSPYTIIKACHMMISPRISAKSIAFDINCDENCPKKLFGDEIRIRQILTNILTNAAKYTEKGRIVMNMKWLPDSEESGRLMLSVKDSGIGISEENKAKLFNAFERVDETRNRNIEGTGLGLSITSELLRLMNGTIDVESEYGKGSTFTVYIPQKIVDNAPIGVYEGKSESVKTVYKELFKAPKARILAVDDNKMNLVVLKGLLKRTEVQLVTVSSGQEALDTLASDSSFNIILMDHMMPGMSGIEANEAIKMMPSPVSDIPVLMLTANAISGVEEEYLRNGFTDYLAKPVNGHLLEEKLMKYLPKDLIEA